MSPRRGPTPDLRAYDPVVATTGEGDQARIQLGPDCGLGMVLRGGVDYEVRLSLLDAAGHEYPSEAPLTLRAEPAPAPPSMPSATER